jgi:hypothetical protein
MKTHWEHLTEAAQGILSSPAIHSTWRRTYRLNDHMREITVEVLPDNGGESLRFTDHNVLEEKSHDDALKANGESQFWKYSLVRGLLVRQMDLFSCELDCIPELLGPPVPLAAGSGNDDYERRRLWAGLQSEIPGLRGDDDLGYSVELRVPISGTAYTIACTLNSGNHIRLTAPILPAVPESESASCYLMNQNQHLSHCRASLDSNGRYALIADLSRNALMKGESLRLFSSLVESLQVSRHIACLADRAVSQIYSTLHSSTLGGTPHGITSEVHSSSFV